MDVIVHYLADLVKIRKFETSEIKIFNLSNCSKLIL